MNWTWDDDKNSANIQKHGISFETAILALGDPLSVTDDDPYPLGAEVSDDRCSEKCRPGGRSHTLSQPDPDFDVEVGRIISARRATSHERRKL